LVIPIADAVGALEVVTLFVEASGLLLILKVGEPGMVGKAVEVLVSLLKFQPAMTLAAGGCMSGLLTGRGFRALAPRGSIWCTIRPSEST
jgi:hypothetical protein